jgi:hypothetical protein
VYVPQASQLLSISILDAQKCQLNHDEQLYYTLSVTHHKSLHLQIHLGCPLQLQLLQAQHVAVLIAAAPGTATPALAAARS